MSSRSPSVCGAPLPIFSAPKSSPSTDWRASCVCIGCALLAVSAEGVDGGCVGMEERWAPNFQKGGRDADVMTFDGSSFKFHTNFFNQCQCWPSSKGCRLPALGRKRHYTKPPRCNSTSLEPVSRHASARYCSYACMHCCRVHASVINLAQVLHSGTARASTRHCRRDTVR